MKKPNLLCYNYWQSIADHVLDFSYEHYEQVWGIQPLERYPEFDPGAIKEGDLVFVKTDFIETDTFFDYYFSKIKVKFNLITSASSFQLGQYGTSFIKLLFDDKILHWFCTNPPNIKHDKIIPLPIGFAEPCRPTADQEILNYWRENHTPYEEKIDKILLPYHNNTTNPKREFLFNTLKELDNVVVQERSLPLNEYLYEMDKYKKVYCFPGKGQDTHRFYETILVGSIPLLIENTTMRTIFNYWKLPGIFFVPNENHQNKSNPYQQTPNNLLCETYRKKIMETIR